MRSTILKGVRTFLLAVLAGIAISIGGVAYLSVENKIVGAFLFAAGLYAICVQGLNLYTGKIGYLFDNPPSYLWTLLVIWIGNWTGAILAAQAVNVCRIRSIAETAKAVCASKLADGYGSLFLLAVFCGLLVFVAVDGYKKTQNPLILFICVAGFILCGFEHCIADMFYFSMADAWSASSVLRIVVITLGNSVGGLLIPLVKKLPEKE